MPINGRVSEMFRINTSRKFETPLLVRQLCVNQNDAHIITHPPALRLSTPFDFAASNFALRAPG